MKWNRWFGFVASAVLLLSVLNPLNGFAEEKRMLQDESIYDLLVDRFNNGNFENDIDVNTKEPNMFSGGDFAGLIDKIDYISEMGFTMISIGPVFSTATYDGREVLDYEKIEPHFGTEEELAEMIEAFGEKEIGVMADFPLNGVSKQHVWAKDGRLPTTQASSHTVDWDQDDQDVRAMLKEAILAFVTAYDWDGIRLTQLGDFDTDYLNELIGAIKEEKPHLYVLTTDDSTAQFDSMPNIEKGKALQQTYVEFDPDSSGLSLFSDKVETDLIQFDDLTSQRFTDQMVEKRMFPPARWQLALTALFTLPGVPVMTYETEIAVSGKEAPEIHPIVNFKTDTELYDFITDLNYLRNESEALRNGDFEMMHNENGFTVFKRSSDEETWIIALNNTSEIANLPIPKEVIGDNKRLRGVLTGDSIPKTKDENYNVVLEREVGDIFIVEDDRGFNTPYLIASILVYVLFLGFLYVVWRKGRQKAKENA